MILINQDQMYLAAPHYLASATARAVVLDRVSATVSRNSTGVYNQASLWWADSKHVLFKELRCETPLD